LNYPPESTMAVSAIFWTKFHRACGSRSPECASLSAIRALMSTRPNSSSSAGAGLPLRHRREPAGQAMSRYDDLRKMREARSEVKTADATKPVKHYDAGEPIMKFLAILTAAIFLSAPALAETATNSPVSSQFAAAAKAAKVNSKVKKLGPRVCPHPEDDECRAWCCTVGPNALGLVATRPIVPR
jgi:hypothetical protein